MRYRILFSLLYLFISAFISAQLIVVDESIILKTETGDIHGTLKVPENKVAVPLAIVIAGSGPTDRNGNNPQMKNNALKMLTDGLYYNDIASLSFDKRAIGESQAAGKEETDLRFEDYINDVHQWVELLSKDKRFSEIVIVGHSEGSLIGMIVAKNNDKVKKFVSIAGVGEPAANILKEQLTKQLAMQPQMVKDTIFSYIDRLEQGQLINNVPANLNVLFRPSVQPYMISWFKYNPQAELGKLSIPILIVQGTTDIQVSVPQAELLEKSNPNAKKLILDNMNHTLKNCESIEMQAQLPTYNDPNFPLHKGLVAGVSSFIKNK